MKGVAMLIVVGFLLTACEPVSQETTTTTFGPLPPPESPPSTTTTTAAPLEVHTGTYEGWLPDGTQYVVHIDQLLNGAVEGISAGIVMDVDGHPNAIGIADFFWGESDVATSYDSSNGIYQVQAGGLVRIGFYDHILAELPPSPEAEIRTGIRGDDRGDFPVLRLSPPFRWATDDELPLSMEVSYENFVVRRGCGDLAVACSETRALQVIPIDTSRVPIEAWGEFDVFVGSRARRPPDDPSYLDPGPLTPRTIADVHWTGEEMIVWGGGQSGEPFLIDGARLNPTTNQWEMLPPIPLAGEQPTRSIPLGSGLLVVAEEDTYFLAASGDRWVRLADGIEPPRESGFIVLFQGSAYLWNTTGFFSLDVTGGAKSWVRIQDPPFEGGNASFGDRWFSAMVTTDNRLYASLRSDDGCGPREIAGWNGDSWDLVASVTLAAGQDADCSFANQMAAVPEGLAIWDSGHPTMVYSEATNGWHEADPIPIGGQEAPSGPVQVNDQYFMVPQWNQAGFFDSDSEAWALLELPGVGDDSSMVWTGTEFLAWTGTDAWRWTPDVGLIGGDDAA